MLYKGKMLLNCHELSCWSSCTQLFYFKILFYLVLEAAEVYSIEQLIIQASTHISDGDNPV